MDRKQTFELFDVVEQGDLVCGKDRYSADIRFVESVVKCHNHKSVLLVNSDQDLYYEGDEIEQFNKDWRLLCKSEDLIS